MARRIIVEILADTRNVEKGFDRTAKSAKRFETSITGVGRSLRGVGIAAGAALGTREVVQGLQAATMAASDLEEQQNRINVVFGESAASIEAWSQTTAKSFGIAQREALRSASDFGTMFSTIGIGTGKAASMSRVLVELAADMASFSNADPSEMLDRLRSGLAGEAEPLRRFGVFISEARVQQEAWAEGIAKQGRKLTEQQKVLARYSLILQDTKKQQGDFARTSDSLANQMRVLNAEWDEASATLGKVLVPVISWLIEGFNEWTRDVRILADAFHKEFLRIAESAVRMARAVTKTFSFLPDWLGGGWAKDATAKLDEWAASLDAKGRRIGQDFGSQFGLGFQAALDEHLQLKQPRPEGEPGKEPGFKATAEQRNTWFDAMIGRKLDRVQDVRTLAGQISALRAIAGLIRERLAIVKDITYRQTLEDTLLGVQRQIRGTLEASKARAEQLADERRQLAKERREREALARQTRQFALLGFGAGGADLVPGMQALRKRLGRMTDAIRGTFLDTSKTRSVLGNIRKLLSGELGKLDAEVRNKIEEMLAGIDKKLKEHQEKRGRFRAFNVNQMLTGLGLSPDEIRSLRGRLAQIGPGGTVPGRGVGAFGMVPVVVNHQTIVDGRVVEASVTKRQQNRRRRNPSQKRGPYIGTLG